MATQATRVIDKNGRKTTVHKKVPTQPTVARSAFRSPPPASSFANSSVGLAVALGNAVDTVDEGMENFFGTFLGGEEDVFAREKRERAERRANRRAAMRRA